MFNKLREAIPQNMNQFTKNLNKIPGVRASNFGSGRYQICINGEWFNITARTPEEALYEINRNDPTDQEERRTHEKLLEANFKRLHETVLRAQEEARAIIKALPVPKSAIVRKNPIYWEHPSYELSKQFPELFP